MTNPFNNPALVGKTPLLTTFLLEFANAGQLWRMWAEHSAAGQNVWSWAMVNVALLLFLNFYRVNNKNGCMNFAIIGTLIGVVMNLGVIFTILYFRYGV